MKSPGFQAFLAACISTRCIFHMLEHGSGWFMNGILQLVSFRAQDTFVFCTKRHLESLKTNPFDFFIQY